MRVLYLTPWYPLPEKPNNGIFVRDQVQAISAHHTVHVVISKVRNDSFGFFSYTLRQEVISETCVEHHLTFRRSLPVLNQLIFLWVTYRVACQVARTFAPQVVHGTIGYPGACWAWAVGKRLGIPAVLTEHTRMQNHFRSVWYKFLTLFCMKRLQAITCVSQSLAKEIQQHTGITPVVIPNIIQVEKLAEMTALSADPVCQFGFLGSLNTPVKGLDVMLKALRQVKDNFHCHIGGTGLLLDSYKALAEEEGVADRCTFYGFVPHWDVPAFFSRLNFFVSASRYESFGMVIAEAMASGLPVVATASGGPQDFVKAFTGVLVAPNDEQALAQAISAMIRQHRQYDRDAIRRYAREQFSVDTFREKTDAVYASVVR